VAIVDHHVAAFEVALLGQTLSKYPDERFRQPARGKKGHHWTGRLLRACRDRPRGRRTAEQHDELATLHLGNDSITSSAMASMLAGRSSPSAFAVLRLITSWNFVGACTGRPVIFSPLRIRSTYLAAPRNCSIRSGPYEIKPPSVTLKRSE